MRLHESCARRSHHLRRLVERPLAVVALLRREKLQAEIDQGIGVVDGVMGGVLEIGPGALGSRFRNSNLRQPDRRNN